MIKINWVEHYEWTIANDIIDCQYSDRDKGITVTAEDWMYLECDRIKEDPDRKAEVRSKTGMTYDKCGHKKAVERQVSLWVDERGTKVYGVHRTGQGRKK